MTLGQPANDTRAAVMVVWVMIISVQLYQVLAEVMSPFQPMQCWSFKTTGLEAVTGGETGPFAMVH